MVSKPCQDLGQPDVDLFASWLCHHLPAYMALKPESGSQATDAFKQAWNYYLQYVFPPFSLIGRVLAKVRRVLDFNHTQLADTGLVQSSSRNGSTGTVITTEARSLNESSGENTSTSGQQNVKAGNLAGHRISKTAANLIANSRRQV